LLPKPDQLSCDAYDEKAEERGLSAQEKGRLEVGHDGMTVWNPSQRLADRGDEQQKYREA